MIAEELINHMIPPLKITDDAHKAIVWMEEFRCMHLPVVDEGNLLGFVRKRSFWNQTTSSVSFPVLNWWVRIAPFSWSLTFMTY